jgi:hypothetical protein
MACEKVEVPFLELLLWIRTRWASLFAFLDRILRLRKVRRLWVSEHILINVVACVALCTICGRERYGSQAKREKLLWFLPPKTWLGEAWADAWGLTSAFEINSMYLLLIIVSRNRLVQSRHFRARKSQALSARSLFSSFWKRLGAIWLSFLGSRKLKTRSKRALRALKSIMERLMTRMHISSASVSQLLEWFAMTYSIYLVLDPNVKNAYALDKWESDVYARAMSRLEEVVSKSLYLNQVPTDCQLVWFISCTVARSAYNDYRIYMYVHLWF